LKNRHIEDALSRFREKKLPVPESRCVIENRLSGEKNYDLFSLF